MIHRLNWASHIKPTRSKIRLGDQRTVVESNEELHGNIFFQSVSGQEVSASINFVSHSMPGMDVIFGYEDSEINLLDDEVIDSLFYSFPLIQENPKSVGKSSNSTISIINFS